MNIKLQAFRREQKLLRIGDETTHWSNHREVINWRDRCKRTIKREQRKRAPKVWTRKDCAFCLCRIGYGKRSIRRAIGMAYRNQVQRWRKAGVAIAKAVINDRRPNALELKEQKRMEELLLWAFTREQAVFQRQDLNWSNHPAVNAWTAAVRYRTNRGER